MTKSKLFLHGMRDAIPIGLGYFAVSFSLGIVAGSIGFTAVQSFFLSLLNNASAGEYAGLAAIRARESLPALALLILIANARYLLMSCALSQKLSPDLPMYHRFLLGFDITDELFGLAIKYRGYVEPIYMYGAFAVALPAWAVGTALGTVAGNLLPARIVTALGAAVYGMFISIVVPPAKRDKRLFFIVLISFAVSAVFAAAPLLKTLSGGIRIIVLTVIISTAAALISPLKEDEI